MIVFGSSGTSAAASADEGVQAGERDAAGPRLNTRLSLDTLITKIRVKKVVV